MSEKKILPFGMLHTEPEVDRKYEVYPQSWNYDAKSQVTDLPSFGVTFCLVASTGTWLRPGSDSDEGRDDTH